jgi:GAF domain-containing protein
VADQRPAPGPGLASGPVADRLDEGGPLERQGASGAREEAPVAREGSPREREGPPVERERPSREREETPLEREVARLDREVAHLQRELGRRDAELRRIRDTLPERVVGRTAALAAANARLQLELAERQRAEADRLRRTAQLRGLAGAAFAITSTLHLDEVLAVVTEAAREIVGAHMAVTSVTTDEDWAQAIVHVSLSAKYAAWRSYDARPSGAGIYRLVCQSNRAMRLTQAELEADPAWRGFGAEAGRHPPLRGWLAAPLTRLHGQNQGLIQLSDRVEGEFTEDDEAILVQLAQLASVAMENARLYEEAERRRRAAETLAEVSRAITQSLSVADVAQQIVDRVRALLGGTMATLFRLDSPSGDLVAVAVAGQPALGRGPGFVIPAGTGVSGAAVAERRPVAATDAFADPWIADTPEVAAAAATAAYRAVLSVPLTIQGRVIGTLAVGKPAGERFDDEDTRLAQGFAAQAAVALENARLYEDARRRLAEVTTVQRVARAVNSTLRLEEVFRTVVTEISAAFGYGLVSIYLRKDEALLLQASVGYDQVLSRLPLDRSASGRVVRSGRAELLSDVARDPDFLLCEPGVRQAIIAPLAAGDGQVLGTLAVESTGVPELTETDLGLLMLLADQVSVAVANARLYGESARRQREAETVAEVAGRLTEILDVEGVAKRVVESAMRVLGARFARLRLLEPDGSLRTAARADAAGVRTDPERVLPAGMGLSARIVADGRPMATPDLLGDARVIVSDAARQRIAAAGNRALLGVPLRLKGRVFGVLSVSDEVGREFSEAEATLLQTFADQAALALENARLFEAQRRLLDETRRQHREAVALEAVAREITSSLDRQEVLQRIVDSARELCACDLAYLAPYDPGTDTATIAAASGARSAALLSLAITRGHGLGGRVLESGEPRVTADYLADPTLRPANVEPVRQEGIVTQATVPVRLRGAITGLLSAANRTPRPFTPLHLDVLKKLADQAAIALANSRLYAERARAEAELRGRARREAALAELGQRALAGGSLDTVLREAVDVVCQVLDAERAGILEPDPAGAEPWTRLAREAGERGPGDPARAERRRASGAAVPIQGRHQPLGILAAESREPHGFTPDDVHFLRSVAGVLATAIERQHAEEALRHHAERLGVLRRIDGAILAAQSAGEIAAATLPHLRRLVPCARAGVAVYDLDAGEATTLAVDTEAPTPLTVGQRAPLAIFGDVDRLRSGEPHVEPDLAARPELFAVQRALLADGVRSYVVVPLIAHGELIGSLNLGSTGPGALPPEQMAIAREVADSLAVALHNARLLEQVLAARARLQALSHRLVEVQETERRHLARELHDEIGQVLTVLKLGVEKLARLPDETVARELAEPRRLIEELIHRVRELSLDLRPPMLDDFGLVPTLLWHFERYSTQTGVRVAFEHVGLEGRFAPGVETAAYRIVQEALTNVARHAGVPEVTVRIWTDDDALNVQVEDRGRGLARVPGAATGGISGMQERAVLLGGQLAVEFAPGGGTRVTAQLPLAARVERRGGGR